MWDIYPITVRLPPNFVVASPFTPVCCIWLLLCPCVFPSSQPCIYMLGRLAWVLFLYPLSYALVLHGGVKHVVPFSVYV